MARAKAQKRIEFDPPVHPGEYLAEEIAARGLSQKALAEEMGRPVQVVNEIIRGKKAVTAETALDLEAVLDIPARFWLGFQVEYDLTAARLRRGAAA
jgi:HTH-type transcriptional regulator / antitoxin HigA